MPRSTKCEFYKQTAIENVKRFAAVYFVVK